MIDPTQTVWDVCFPDQAPMIKMALTAIVSIPDELMVSALDQLCRQESIMPMLDPTAWLDGRRWKNVDDYKKMINLMRQMAALIRKEPK